MTDRPTPAATHESPLLIVLVGTAALIAAIITLLWSAIAGTPHQFGASLFGLVFIVLAFWRWVQ